MSAPAYASQFVLKRLPADDDELWWTVFALWGYRIPRQRVCHGHVSPFDAFAEAYFAREPASIWKASRGLGGKSRTLAVLGLTETALLGIEVTVLGGSGGQSKNVHDATKDAWGWHAAPRGLLTRPPTTFDTVLNNGGHMRTLTASQTSVRGPHPPRLRCLAGWTRVQTPLGMLPIETVEPGLAVLVSDDMATPSWGVVSAVADQGYQATLGVELNDGTVITCTPDHRFATQDGWVEAQFLMPSHVLNVQRTFGRERAAQDGDVPGLLGGGTPSFPADAPLPGLSGAAQESAVGTLQALQLRQAGSNSLVLSGLRNATEAAHYPAMSSLSPEADGLGCGSRTLRGSKGDGEGRDQNIQGRGSGSRADGHLGADVHAGSSVGTLGAGLRAGRPDSDRSARGVLARSPAERSAGSAEAGSTGSRRPQSAVLEDGPDALVVVGLYPGPLIRTWDITTTSGNFYAEGVLVHNCDEIDEMDQAILDAALGQPMEQIGTGGMLIPTQTVLSSTHQYPDKTMSEMINRFNEKGLPVHQWCFKETSNPTDGWLTTKAIARAKEVVSDLMWKTEYELQEPSFGNRAIDADAIERCFDTSLGEFAGDKFVLADYVEGRHYITAIDWAKMRDQTIIGTFDTTDRPWRCVAWQKVNNLPWPMLVARAVAQWRIYGDQLVHDATGVGVAAHDMLREQVTSGEFAKVKGVTMGGGRERDALYTEYIAAIEHDDVRYPRITYAYDEHRYVTPDALFTNKEHAPDSVVMGALAWSARKKGNFLAVPGGGTRASSPWNV